MDDQTRAGLRPRPFPGIAPQELLQRLREAPAIPLRVLGQAAAQELLSGPCLVTGWALANATAAVDTLHLFAGPSSGGIPAGDVTIGANSGSAWCSGDDGIFFQGGITVTQGTGAITGAVYVKF